MYEASYSEISEFKLESNYTKSLSKFCDSYLDKLINAQTVIILGGTGNGKSILLKMLSKKLDYNYFDGIEDTIRLENKNNICIDPIWKDFSLLSDLVGSERVIISFQNKDDFLHLKAWKYFINYLKQNKYRKCILLDINKEHIVFQQGLIFFNLLHHSS